MDIFREAGLPDKVFNFFCPGCSWVTGDYMVGHSKVTMVIFTSLMDVGLHIIEQTAKVAPGQKQCKRIVAEMGGKNAIIIDEDADLDEVVSAVLYSAFIFQGQKCSACLRVVVLGAVYDRFVSVSLRRQRRLGLAWPKIWPTS
ncbi:hypothetical protein DSUL_20559 [Desulfovibrionales bacterium]